MEKKVTAPWIKGLVICLILIVFSLVIYFAGQANNKSLGWLQGCIIIAGLIWACTSYAKQMDGNVTFGNVFSHGFKATAAMTVIYLVYTFVAYKFLFPEMLDEAINQARAEMEKKGNLSEDEIEQGIGMIKKFFTPFMLGGIILMFAIVGAIGSLIGAAVAKKNPNPTPFEQ